MAVLNLNHRKCCWVQYRNDSCHDLLDWVSTNCEEFREMKIVKYAKYVGTMIGPEEPRRATGRLQNICPVCPWVYGIHIRT